jgi:DNA invertase Pin-like site-specific DNA recombinase
MARKAERYNAIAGRNGTADADNTMISVTTGKKYRVALYARLSVEKDGRKSDSIESQFMIMENFIKERPELAHYQKYFDRGVSGTTFDRPDFMRMMDDVRAGRIDCIIVKDLSRFGRDYLETGNYIETILPFLGVRFISVNDHFDTVEDYNGNKGLGISLMNLVNDMYAKDVSKRITSAFQSCMERGSVLGHAPYGYSSVKIDDGHRLVIDEPAAEIVRRIFEMAKTGMSHRAIARELTQAGVRIPEEYRQTQLTYITEGEPLSEWKNGTISQILSNEAYIGTLQQGKTKRCLYQGIGRHKVSKDEWTTHENAHEAIISKELFYEIRSVMDKKKEKQSFGAREDLPMTADKYKGILKCPVCGGDFSRESSIIYSGEGDVRLYYYRCRHNPLPVEERDKEAVIKISEEQLDLLVLASLQKAVKELVPDKKKLLNALEKGFQPAETKLKARIADLKKRTERLSFEGSELYRSYVKGEISRDELADANSRQEQERIRLDNELLQAEKDYRAFVRNTKEQKKFVNTLVSVKDKSVLTPELISTLIAKITLTADRNMEIQYRFHNDASGGYTDVFQYPRRTKWNEGGRTDV